MSVNIQIDVPLDNIPLDTPSDIPLDVEVPVNIEYEKDCFGRIRNPEEIRKRDKFRSNIFWWIFSITIFIILVTFPTTMLLSIPNKGNVNALFIVSSIIVCITWGPIIIGLIGFFILIIGNCCYDLI